MARCSLWKKSNGEKARLASNEVEKKKWRIDRYIEVQVWDDRPIWEFFSQTSDEETS